MRKSLPFWLMAMFAIFFSTSGSAQQFSALIDADRDPLTGCSLATADGTAVGIEWRVTATVGGDPPQVSAVERAQCVNGSFGAPIAMAAGYPVGLNNGVDGSDVVEFAAALAELTGISRDVSIYFLAQSAGGADLQGPLPLTIGSITGGPVVTEPAIIPTMHWLGLTIIFFAVLLLARRHRALRGVAVVFMLLGAGLVWAANFIPDGQVGDWATETPLATSLAPSSSNGESDIDIVAVWAADEAGRLFFRIDVRDLEGPANAAPVAEPQAVTTAVDTDVTVVLACTDADGDSLSFAISAPPANGSLGAITPLGASSASVMYTPDAGYSGPDSFQFTCDDGTVTSAPATVTITVSAAPNEPPSFVSAPVTGALVDALYTYDVLADDPDAGDTLTLTAPLLPTWLSFVDNGDRSGELSGTPGAADVGEHPVLLQVSDGIVSVTQEFTITVSEGPVITSANAATFVVGSAESFTITTAGSPTVTTVSLAGGLPSGVSFVDNGDGTATLSGTPDAGSAADYPVQITAENGVGPDAVQDFTLVVNQAPSFDSADAVTFVAGSPGSFSVQTSGRPTPAVASSGSLPTGVSFVDNGDGTATLSGTPAAGTGGSYPLILTASNSAGSVDQGFTLTVDEAPGFTSAAATSFTVGDAGNFAITTFANPAVTSIIAGGDALPGGVSFTDNADGTASLAGTPDALSGGEYAITFTASNGIPPDGVQNFNLTVNEAPGVTSANNATFAIGSPQSFIFTASGFPMPTFTLDACTPALPGSLSLDANSGELSGTPLAGDGGNYSCTLTASNGIGSDATQAFALSIEAAPQFTSAGFTTFTVGAAGNFDITTFANPAVTSIIAGGDVLPGGVSFTDNADGTASLAGTPDALTGGVYAITFTASNGIPPNGVQNFSLTVNEAPSITSANNATFAIGSPQSFTFTASGFPAPTFTLDACAPALPGSLSLDANSGELSGTPLAGDGGNYSCTLTASNGIGSDATQAFTLSIEAAPQFTSAASTTFTVGDAGSFDITTIANPAVTSISAGGDVLPGGVLFTDNADGTASLAGTPAALSGGEYAITFTASNGIPPDGVQSFSLTVNEAPGVTSANNATFAIGSPQSFIFTASGFPAPTFSLDACTPALPGSLSLDANSGELSGTPLASDGGTYSCTLTASNGIGSDATQAFTLSIEAAPQFTSADVTTFTVGAAGNFDITTFAVPTVTSIIAGGDALPGGVLFTDNADGTASLAGTPDALSGGEYAITFTASNGIPPDGVQNFNLTVNEAPGVTSANNATFAIGSPQSFIFTASGFPAPTFTLDACTPALPGSLSLNAVSGELSGTPLAGEGGSYACTLTASNGIGSDATQAFTLMIEEAPSITSGALASFAVGIAGSFTATAEGFPAPTFTLTACTPALPASLSFDGNSGELTGTPLASEGGSYACTLTATNGVAPNAVQGLTVEISEAPVFTSADNTSFIVGQLSSFNVTTSGFPTSTIGQSGVLPGGISFLDNGNGTATLSGTPAAGSQTGSPYTLDLEASNGVTPNAQQSFSLSVQCPVIALVPAVGAFAVNFGSAFSQSFTPSGGTGPYTFAVAGALPPGVSLNTGSGLVSGTATDAGVYSFSLQATDAFGCASPSQGYTLSVNLIATADAYNALGNVFVDSSTVPFSVVGNDNFPAGTTISNFDATSSPGNGAVTMTTAAGVNLGQFTYNPPRGRSSGIETFTYTLSRQGVGATGAVTATATVTFTHSGRVWFVNNAGGACAASCDGRQSNPYTSLAAFQTDNNGTGSNPAGNDSIFIHSGNYTGPVTLLAGQRLIGQGASSTLAALSGVTVQPGQNLPATSGGAPSLAVAAGGTTVTLGSDNRLHGLHFGNAGAAGTALLGNAFGTLTISENVLITTNGRALNLENGAVSGTGFTSVSSNGSGSEGIRLVGLTAGSNLQLGTGAIAGSNGTAFLAQGTLGTINYAGPISKTTAGRLIDVGAGASGTLTLSGNLSCTGTCGTGAGNHGLRVSGRTGGTLTFSNASKVFSSSAINPGVSLTSNTGATLNFTGGGLVVTTTGGAGFEATGGGTVTVQGAGNTVTTTTGTAVNVSATTIGAAGMAFQSVNSTTASANTAIILSNTGNGAFSVSGTGPAGSGGTISNKSVDAVQLNTTGGLVTLNQMIIQDIGNMAGAIDTRSGHDAIQGLNVNGGLSLTGTTIRRISDQAIHGGIQGGGVDTATVWNGLTLSGVTIENSNRYHVAGSGDANNEGMVRILGIRGAVNISNSTFSLGAQHLDLEVTGGALNLTATGNTFDRSYKEFTSGVRASIGNHCIDVRVLAGASAVVTIGDRANPALGNNFLNCRIGSVRVVNQPGAGANTDAIIARNNFRVNDHSSGIGGDFDFPMGGVLAWNLSSGTVDTIVENNLFELVTNASGGSGQLSLIAEGGPLQALVQNNTFDRPGNAPWWVQSRNSPASVLTARFVGNTVIRGAFPCTTDPSCGGGYFAPGLRALSDAQGGATMNFTMQNNVMARHDTGFDPGQTVELRSLNEGGGVGGIVCGSFQNNQSPDGYSLEQFAGTLRTVGAGSCPPGSPSANCQAVFQNNGNQGGGGVSTTVPPFVNVAGAVTVSATACPIPTGAPF